MPKSKRLPTKHLQIKEHLARLIRSGRLGAGQKIPSEYALASQFGVNKTTANKAVAMLVSDGFLKRKHGAGTFVADPFARNAPLIGIYLNLRPGTYFSHLLVGAQEEAQTRSYGLLFFQSPANETEIDVDRFWKYVRATGITGLIINRPFQPGVRNLPVVFLDTAVRRAQADQVQTDNAGGGRLLARHFLECGHRHVAFISQDATRGDLMDRARGFRDEFRKRGLGESAERLHGFSKARHNLLAVINQLLSADHRITGIAFDSDHVARQGIQILRRLRKRVPLDISVAGFGNVPSHDGLLKITSIEQHPLTLGHLAVATLIERLEGRLKGPVQRICPVELVKGDSVAVVR
jgi:DNA-binding LacI/PurR family transcriptional regulator